MSGRDHVNKRKQRLWLRARWASIGNGFDSQWYSVVWSNNVIFHIIFVDVYNVLFTFGKAKGSLLQPKNNGGDAI